MTDERNAIDDDDDEADLRRPDDRDARARRSSGRRTRVGARVILDHEDNVYAPSIARDGCAAFGMIGVLAGQVIDRDTLVDGRTHRGWALAEKMGSLYAPASRRALAAALDRALASAATD